MYYTNNGWISAPSSTAYTITTTTSPNVAWYGNTWNTQNTPPELGTGGVREPLKTPPKAPSGSQALEIPTNA